jgi:hypothetical protein
MTSRNPSLAQIRNEFKDLSTAARVSIIAAVVLELAGKIASWVDLSRRPAGSVRGPKWVWALAQLINGVGPAAYWAFGRR